MFSRDVGQEVIRFLPRERRNVMRFCEVRTLEEVEQMDDLFQLDKNTLKHWAIGSGLRLNDPSLVSLMLNNVILDESTDAKILNTAIHLSGLETCRMLLSMPRFDPLTHNTIKTAFIRDGMVSVGIIEMLVNHPRILSEEGARHLLDQENARSYLHAGLLSFTPEKFKLILASPVLTPLLSDLNSLIRKVSELKYMNHDYAISICKMIEQDVSIMSRLTQQEMVDLQRSQIIYTA